MGLKSAAWFKSKSEDNSYGNYISDSGIQLVIKMWFQFAAPNSTLFIYQL